MTTHRFYIILNEYSLTMIFMVIYAQLLRHAVHLCAINTYQAMTLALGSTALTLYTLTQWRQLIWKTSASK